MAGCPSPPLLQNRACDFHRTRLLRGVILVMDTVFLPLDKFSFHPYIPLSDFSVALGF